MTGECIYLVAEKCRYGYKLGDSCGQVEEYYEDVTAGLGYFSTPEEAVATARKYYSEDKLAAYGSVTRITDHLDEWIDGGALVVDCDLDGLDGSCDWVTYVVTILKVPSGAQ